MNHAIHTFSIHVLRPGCENKGYGIVTIVYLPLFDGSFLIHVYLLYHVSFALINYHFGYTGPYNLLYNFVPTLYILGVGPFVWEYLFFFASSRSIYISPLIFLLFFGSPNVFFKGFIFIGQLASKKIFVTRKYSRTFLRAT